MSPTHDLVIRAFADGAEISAKRFAEQIGAGVMSVTRAIEKLKPWLHREDRSRGKGERMTVYRAKDPHALRAAFLGSGPSFGELLGAWGIAHRDINLPFIRHFRSEEA